MTSSTARIHRPQWEVGAPVPVDDAASPAAPPGGVAAAGGESTTAQFVITLTSTTMPIRETLPRLPAFADARVFCEPYLEAGVARIRVQLGYFRSMHAAAQALFIVRPDYPRATVHGVRRPSPPERQVPPSVPAREGDAATNVAAAWPAASAAAPRRAASATAARHLAVELLWCPQPIDLTHVPPLTLFDGLTLYAVAAHRGGHDWHGLRLGFFTDRKTAMDAVDEATSYFTGAIAVPVSDSEFAQATEAEVRPFVARIGIAALARAFGPVD